MCNVPQLHPFYITKVHMHMDLQETKQNTAKTPLLLFLIAKSWFLYGQANPHKAATHEILQIQGDLHLLKIF